VNFIQHEFFIDEDEELGQVIPSFLVPTDTANRKILSHLFRTYSRLKAKVMGKDPGEPQFLEPEQAEPVDQ
jgi:hypothetical protein